MRQLLAEPEPRPLQRPRPLPGMTDVILSAYPENNLPPVKLSREHKLKASQAFSSKDKDGVGLLSQQDIRGVIEVLVVFVEAVAHKCFCPFNNSRGSSA